MEIRGLGGAALDAVLAQLRAGHAVEYRGMEIVLHATELECRVVAEDAPATVTTKRALAALTGARFRLGALLASAAPLDALVGNRPHRLVLVEPGGAGAAELFELRGDRLRRLPGDAP